MTEESTHQGPFDVDPADAGATIGGGLVPDEVTEGEAEEQAVRQAQQTAGSSAEGGRPS